ncbi:MAG: hypothetical protein KatS3mg121_0230 [Gammaproteobacteria bacterium]|nr:MAG: hypothetical protein KatS3mg121_0230 [Gammaproteobacteria bacterium]
MNTKTQAQTFLEHLLMSRRGLGYLVGAPVALLLGAFAWLHATTPDGAAVLSVPAPAPTDRREPADASPFAARTPSATTQSAASSLRAQTVEVAAGEPQPILGQFITLREVREVRGEAGNGPIRNIEFVFRPGILPRRLFDDHDKVIAHYAPIDRNVPGAGATTVFFLYTVIQHDTDGDGWLGERDKFNIAISRPDGSRYRVLAYNVDELVEYRDDPVENTLHLTYRANGDLIRRSYLLAGL